MGNFETILNLRHNGYTEKYIEKLMEEKEQLNAYILYSENKSLRTRLAAAEAVVEALKHFLSNYDSSVHYTNREGGRHLDECIAAYDALEGSSNG